MRASRRDKRIIIAIAVLSILALFLAWWSAPIRSAHLERTGTTPATAVSLEQPPRTVDEVFRLAHQPPAGNHVPTVSGNVLITADDHTIAAHDVQGRRIWSYAREDAPLCALMSAWNKAVSVYKTGVGCGDAVAIDANTGTYDSTRSAIAAQNPRGFSSNDRVGLVDASRVELWRSDMVRTIEYGKVEAPQEDGQQPHPECEITSAMTRTDLLAITEVCPDDPKTTWLRFLDTTPEDSRAPEIDSEVDIPNPEAKLVAIGQEGAALYLPGSANKVLSISDTGRITEEQPVAPAANHSFVDSPATADLPHHMSWFDGTRLYLFGPSKLNIRQVFEDAIGTGVAVGDHLIYPTAQGLNVADWSTGDILRSINVERIGHDGPVYLNVLGEMLLEQRDGEVVALKMS